MTTSPMSGTEAVERTTLDGCHDSPEHHDGESLCSAGTRAFWAESDRCARSRLRALLRRRTPSS